MSLYSMELDFNKKVANNRNLFTNVDNDRGFEVHCQNDIDVLELYLQQKDYSYKITGKKENDLFYFIFPVLKKGYVKFQFVGKKEENIIASNFFYTLVRDNIVSEVTESNNINLVQVLDQIKNKGIQGMAGKDGLDGANGKDGLDGANGKDGSIGPQGLPGKDGLDGANGKDGSIGPQGLPGKDGIDGVNGKDGAIGTQGLPGEYKFTAKWIKQIKSNGSSGFTAQGTVVGNVQSTITVQAPTNILSRITVQSTAATANANTSLYFSTSDSMRGAIGQPGGFNLWIRFGLPDSSYDGNATSTGSGIVAGLYNGGVPMTTTASGIGNINCACFRRIHNFGVVEHTNWKFVTNNASGSITGNEIDTGLPFTAGNMYLVNISCPSGATYINWYIKNENSGQEASGSTSNLLPPINTLLWTYVTLNTVNAVARKIGTQFIYSESDR